jgi:hypothetical protein
MSADVIAHICAFAQEIMICPSAEDTVYDNPFSGQELRTHASVGILIRDALQPDFSPHHY